MKIHHIKSMNSLMDLMEVVLLLIGGKMYYVEEGLHMSMLMMEINAVKMQVIELYVGMFIVFKEINAQFEI